MYSLTIEIGSSKHNQQTIFVSTKKAAIEFYNSMVVRAYLEETDSTPHVSCHDNGNRFLCWIPESGITRLHSLTMTKIEIDKTPDVDFELRYIRDMAV